MARNLKRDVQAQQLRNYLLFAVSVAIIATMVMGFVLQRRAHTRLGAQKRELEGRISELRRQVNFQTILLAQRSSPMELVRRAEAVGVRKLIAVIGDSNNASSIGVHRSLGFEKVGVIQSCGWKFDRWLDIVLMEKALGEGDKTPPHAGA